MDVKQQQGMHAAVIVGIGLAALGLFALLNDGSTGVGVALLAIGACVITLGALRNRAATSARDVSAEPRSRA